MEQQTIAAEQPSQNNEAVKSADAFLKEQLQEAQPAVDTPVAEPAPGNTTQQPAQSAEPIFKNVVDDKPAEKKHEMAASEIGVPLEVFLTARNLLQAELLKMWAESPSAEKYQYTEDELTMLTKVYAPVMKAYGGVIPWWVWLIMTEMFTTGRKFMQATTDRKINRENKRLKANPKVRQMVSNAEDGERRYWSIDAEGYYEYGATGGYIVKEERTEKASLKDVAALLNKNGRRKVMKAFNLSDEEMDKYQGEA